MADHKREHDTRKVQKSSQSAQSVATGLKCNIKVQRQVLELVSRQYADTVDVWRTILGNRPGAEPILKLAEEKVATAIVAHRKVLDMLEEHRNEMSGMAKPQRKRAGKAARESTRVAA